MNLGFARSCLTRNSRIPNNRRYSFKFFAPGLLYSHYGEEDVDRARFIAGARSLDFSLDDIQEILALREQREAPCRVVLDLLQEKADEISRRISELQRMKAELHDPHRLSLTFPTDDVDGKNCVCHLVSEHPVKTVN